MEKLDLDALAQASGGAKKHGPRDKYVSAFYCEYCGKTIHLNMTIPLSGRRRNTTPNSTRM